MRGTDRSRRVVGWSAACRVVHVAGGPALQRPRPPQGQPRRTCSAGVTGRGPDSRGRAARGELPRPPPAWSASRGGGRPARGGGYRANSGRRLAALRHQHFRTALSRTAVGRQRLARSRGLPPSSAAAIFCAPRRAANSIGRVPCSQRGSYWFKSSAAHHLPSADGEPERARVRAAPTSPARGFFRAHGSLVRVPQGARPRRRACDSGADA